MLETTRDFLDKAALVLDDREVQYGKIEETLRATAQIEHALLGEGDPDADSDEVLDQGALGVLAVYIAGKLAREYHSHRNDNIIDAINYMATYGAIADRSDHAYMANKPVSGETEKVTIAIG